MASVVPIENCSAVGGPSNCRYHKKVIQVNTLATKMIQGSVSQKELDAYFVLRRDIENPASIKEENLRAEQIKAKAEEEIKRQKLKKVEESLHELTNNDLANKVSGQPIEYSRQFWPDEDNESDSIDLTKKVFEQKEVQDLIDLIAVALTEGDKSKISLNLDEQGDAYISFTVDDVDMLMQEAIVERHNKNRSNAIAIEFWNKAQGEDQWGHAETYFWFTPDNLTSDEWDSFESPR